MKLVHVDFARQLEIPRQGAAQWIIESPALFSRYLQELYGQWEGREGNFVLVEKEKEVDFAKAVEIIINPFALNLQDKHIVNKLYQELQQIAMGENLYQQTGEMLHMLEQYLYDLEQESPYLLSIHDHIDITALLKACGVQLEYEEHHLIETVALYIRILAELLRKRLIIFVQIGRYFTPEQRVQIQEIAAHHDIALLFIETEELDYTNLIPRYIIDADGCEI